MHGFFIIVRAQGRQRGVEIDFLVIRSGGNGLFKGGQRILVLALRQKHISQAETCLGISRVQF